MTGTGDGNGDPARLFVLDGMSLAFRAYFALPTDLATKDGIVTNALHGFVSMLVSIVRDHHPSALAVAFDLPGTTFRDEIIEDYKGGRAETPEDLLPQFDMIRSMMEALAIPVVTAPGYEADDVLATLATQAQERACDVVVVTGDRDCFQLVSDPYVRVLYNRRGVSDYALYDEAGIIERTGVPPEKYPLLASLRGDPSDNLPGVPGVGEKTAAKLVNAYGDLDGIYAHLGEVTPKLRESLGRYEETVRSNASVIPLVRDVPCDLDVGDLSLGGWDRATVRAEFERWELRTLWGRVEALLDKGAFGVESPRAEVSTDPGERAAQNRGGGPERSTASVGDSMPRATSGPGDRLEIVEVPDSPVPANAGEAVSRLAVLVGAAGGRALAMAARWDGIPGRSAMSVLTLVVAGPDGQGVCLTRELLAAAKVTKAVTTTLGSVPVVGHHAKEVMRSLLLMHGDCTALVMDTAIAAYLIDPSRGDYALDVVARAFGIRSPADALSGDPAGDVEGASTDPSAGDGSTEQLALVAADDGPGDEEAVVDAATVATLVDPLRRRLMADGLIELHDSVEVPLVRVLARMEVAGIRVDVAELRRIADQMADDAARLEHQIEEIAGHPFNVNSTPQLRVVLYEELKLVPGRKTKTGYSTDAATLESLRGTHPIIDPLLEYREVEKLRSTYGTSLLAEVGDDERIHASFRQTVARTGRLSSERPNLHNIPARSEMGQQFRRAFVPADGFRFLVADYDQVELRVIAHLSKDPGLIGALTSGSDIHRTVAAGIFGVPPDEVTHAQRERAKAVSYGLAYGMEAYGLARRLGTSVTEANEIMERYFTAFPSVRMYMEQTVAEARVRGLTRTERGRVRPFPDLHSRDRRVRLAAERSAMNAGIQGLAADVFKAALVRLDRALETGRMRSRLVLQVHDEVIVEATPGEEAEVEALTKTALTGAAELSVPLEVSLAWGTSWAEAKSG
ncbi:MAG: DNA polymerase I [Acidimicrobiales bacterium]